MKRKELIQAKLDENQKVDFLGPELGKTLENSLRNIPRIRNPESFSPTKIQIEKFSKCRINCLLLYTSNPRWQENRLLLWKWILL